MNQKALILGMYLIAVFIILRNWYNQGNSGMPYPTTITAPSYLYATLGIASDFVGGLAAVLAVGLTLGLYYKIHKDPSMVVKVGGGKQTAHTKITKVPYTVPAPTKPGTNK